METCKFNDCIFYEEGRCSLQHMFSSYTPLNSCAYFRPKETKVHEYEETYF